MVDFQRHIPTQALHPANRLKAGQQRQGVGQANSPVTNNKPTWVASQGPKWKVANGKNEGGTIPLAIHKQRLQASTTASKTPTPKKTLAERSAVPKPAEKIKFEALKQAVSAEHVLKNRPEIDSVLKKAGYKPNEILCPRRILPEKLIGELKPLGAGALNQAYTGVFQTEDGKEMEVIIKFEQQYKEKKEMPEFLMGLGIDPKDTRESSRNLAAKTLDNLLGWNNIVHTELGVLKDPSSGEYRVVTAMAKAEGRSGYGQILGDKTIFKKHLLEQYTDAKNDIANFNKKIPITSDEKQKIESELKTVLDQIDKIQEKQKKLGKLQLLENRKLSKEKNNLQTKAKHLDENLKEINNTLENLKNTLQSCKDMQHQTFAKLKFYNEAVKEVRNEKKQLIGLEGPALGYNIDPQDPKLKSELAKIGLEDAILGQGDRHIGNYFIRTEAGVDGKEKVIGLQGIDNDQLGGTATDIQSYRNLKSLPPEIPSSVCNEILNLKPEEFQRQMECCLPKAEAEAATSRLKLVQEHCQKVLDNNNLNGEGSLLPGWKHDDKNSYYLAFLKEHFPEEAEKLANAA